MNYFDAIDTAESLRRAGDAQQAIVEYAWLPEGSRRVMDAETAALLAALESALLNVESTLRAVRARGRRAE